jgi:hypothetical protein
VNTPAPTGPAAHIAAHRHSSNHRAELESSSSCGCFYCCAIYPPSTITRWIGGQTAMCPRCNIDSVIGDRSGYPITVEFLTAMQRHWFSTRR